MRVGLGHMRIPVSEFWRYSFVEWNNACEGYRTSITGVDPSQTMTHSRLEEMMEMYPDGDRETT